MTSFSRWFFFTLIVTQSFFGCKSGSDSGGGGGSTPADPACASQSVANCASNASCAVNNNQCAGTSSYCGGFTASNTCPTSSCLWNATNNNCVPAGTVISQNQTPTQPPTSNAQCSSQQQATCNTTAGCSWTGTGCIALTNPPSCPSYNSQVCPSITGCGWNGTSCVASTTTTNTSCSGYTTQQTCQPVSGCAWTGTTCSPITSLTCQSFTTALSCPAPSCTWNGVSCQTATTLNTCNTYTTAAACLPSLGCNWNGTACVAATSVPTNSCSQYSGNPVQCNAVDGCQFLNNTCLASLCKNLSFITCTFTQNCKYYILSQACFPG